MAKIRDMSKAAFVAAVESHGMTFEGFMGYVNLGLPGRHACVSHLNAGPNRRAKLAYLLARLDAELTKIEMEDAQCQ